MKIEVTRPFCLAGERLEIGAQADVDDRFGRELIHNGKAVKVEASQPDPAPEAPKRATKRKENDE